MCKKMNGCACVVVLVLVLGNGVCYSQDVESDFNEVLGAIPQPKKAANDVKYWDVEKAAEDFITRHADANAVALLQARAEDPNSRKLALMSLAKLAATDQSAKDALYGRIYEERSDAILTLTYLSPEQGRNLAEDILIREAPVNVRWSAIGVLGCCGDVQTLDMFRQLVAEETNSLLRKAIELAISKMEYKLANSALEADRDRWSRQEALMWRTASEAPLYRNVTGYISWSAAEIRRQGYQLSRDLLEYKLGTGDLLGIAAVGYQQEEWAVDGLAVYAKDTSSQGDFARRALGRIGTEEARRGLEEALIPGGDRGVNKQIMMIFELGGDRQTAEFLREKAQDAGFLDREREYMRAAAAFIEKRLARQ